MVVRQCVICGKSFDTKNRSPTAKTCSKECSKKNNNQRDKQWYQNNREHKLQYSKQWYENNRERKMQYHQDNREYRLQYFQQWYQDNREYKIQHSKQWYQNNRESRLVAIQKYKDQHPEKYCKTKREEETPGLDEAKKTIRQNANYQCELTGWKGDNQIHHLNGYAMFPEQRADLNNLILLKTSIHNHFHNIYGRKGDNTIDQFDEFICNWFPLQVDQFRMKRYKFLPQNT